jgi:hypothetical protein
MFHGIDRDLLVRGGIGLGALLGLMVLSAILREPPLRPAGPFPAPRQIALSEPEELHAPEGHTILATDRYEVEAMVLSRRRYRFDTEAALAPVDLLLGWGPVTSPEVIAAVRFSQADRWGNYRYSNGPPIAPREIDRNASNTHIIPAPGDSSLRRRVLRLRRGDSVRLYGYLVRIEGPGGWKWNSSRTRDDVGNGACEVFYVTELERLP